MLLGVAFMCEIYAPESISACNLEYVVEPANFYVISSNVGALWCLQIMALLISFGSSHTLRLH